MEKLLKAARGQTVGGLSYKGNFVSGQMSTAASRNAATTMRFENVHSAKP